MHDSLAEAKEKLRDSLKKAEDELYEAIEEGKKMKVDPPALNYTKVAEVKEAGEKFIDRLKEDADNFLEDASKITTE